MVIYLFEKYFAIKYQNRPSGLVLAPKLLKLGPKSSKYRIFLRKYDSKLAFIRSVRWDVPRY